MISHDFLFPMLQNESIESRDARRASGVYDTSNGDDKFFRSTGNAVSYASQEAPPVAENYVAPPLSGDDKFLLKSSWSGEHQKANLWMAIPAPPVKDQSEVVPSRTHGDDFFLLRSSWNGQAIKSQSYASIPAPPMVDINDYHAAPLMGDDKFMRRKKWTADQFTAYLPSPAYVQAVSMTTPGRQTVAVAGAC